MSRAVYESGVDIAFEQTQYKERSKSSGKFHYRRRLKVLSLRYISPSHRLQDQGFVYLSARNFESAYAPCPPVCSMLSKCSFPRWWLMVLFRRVSAVTLHVCRLPSRNNPFVGGRRAGGPGLQVPGGCCVIYRRHEQTKPPMTFYGAWTATGQGRGIGTAS